MLDGYLFHITTHMRKKTASYIEPEPKHYLGLKMSVMLNEWFLFDFFKHEKLILLQQYIQTDCIVLNNFVFAFGQKFGIKFGRTPQ